MSANTFTKQQIQTLIAAGIDLNEFFADTPAPAVAKQPKADGRNKAARAHNFEARIARRQDTTRKGGAGMTKAERRALAQELRTRLGREFTTREWNAACKKARGI